MASTTLFAPQVRSVQPAFEYNGSSGEVKIYFSLSAYNKPEEIKKVIVTITDPNINSGWGTNSMINNSTGKLTVAFNKEQIEDGEYYIKINIANYLKTLTKNQYYQVQLVFANDTEESLPSQVTLIRPIPEINKVIIEQNGQTMLSFNKISGFIEYKDGSTLESIKDFYFTIGEYPSKVYSNTMGTAFSIGFNDCYLRDGSYTGTFHYTTLNGYKGNEDFSINIGVDKNVDINLTLSKLEFKDNISAGSVEMSFYFNTSNAEQGQLIIQRLSSKNGYYNWEEVFNSPSLPLNSKFQWADFFVECGTLYQYRFLFKTTNKTYLIDKYDNEIIEHSPNFEDIFLMDGKRQLALRYNPIVSGFKWIKQENITNGLGGKFPIVRVNGDTNYRQFSISGTLSFEMDYNQGFEESLDSRKISMSNWMNEDNTSLFFNVDKAFSTFENILKLNKNFIEKRFRDVAIEFLNEQKPKLFKSPTEGNIIVMLSNISYTPNKQLGRNIYDFTATATEICECTYENLLKHNLIFNNITQKTIYVLPVLKVEEEVWNGVVYLNPYISSQQCKAENGSLIPILEPRVLTEVTYV